MRSVVAALIPFQVPTETTAMTILSEKQPPADVVSMMMMTEEVGASGADNRELRAMLLQEHGIASSQSTATIPCASHLGCLLADPQVSECKA
jgi:hypothetical protein